jgi:hypothetical protein
VRTDAAAAGTLRPSTICGLRLMDQMNGIFAPSLLGPPLTAAMCLGPLRTPSVIVVQLRLSFMDSGHTRGKALNCTDRDPPLEIDEDGHRDELRYVQIETS